MKSRKLSLPVSTHRLARCWSVQCLQDSCLHGRVQVLEIIEVIAYMTGDNSASLNQTVDFDPVS
jgi:hypothetical protein